MNVITKFAEAKSRHITPAKSVHDFQAGDGFLIKSGENVTRKLVKDINPDSNSIVVADPDGGGEQTITLNPNSLPKDGEEFKYWIDEGNIMPNTNLSEMDDLDFDDMDDMDMDFDDDDDYMESSIEKDLNAFLGEEDSTKTSQVPDGSVGGSVSNDNDDNDGEDTEDTPPPHDTTGLENSGTVNQMAGGQTSNVPGSAPTDQVSTSGDVGGSPTIDQTVPQKGEHTPGTPDKASSGSASESITKDIDTAIKLVEKGVAPEKLAGRLLKGA